MKIQWIFHHNPDLIVYGEDGSQEKTIDLAKYNYEELHQLFKTHFRTKVRHRASPHACLARASHVPRTRLTRASRRENPVENAVSPAAPPPVQEMVGGRRLYAANATTSSRETLPLLHDASAPQPDLPGWRLADTLAEWVSCCDSVQQALLYLAVGGALIALLARLLLSTSSRRQRARASKDTATSEHTAGLCHVA